MKIRLEKLAVNISKLLGGKNEKPGRGTLHEKLRLKKVKQRKPTSQLNKNFIRNRNSKPA